MPAAPKPSRRLPEYLLLGAKGFAMGSVDLIPGVSGGTIAFITGIYQELIDSLRTLSQPAFLKALVRFHLRQALAQLNWPFLLTLVLGLVTALFTLAQVIAWLLAHHPVLVWSFFFGLIVASVITVSRRVGRWRPGLWGALLVGLVGAYLLVGLLPTVTPDTLPFVFFSGFIAICAMILPGISGAFLLVLLGKYEFMLGALNQRDWLVIGVFALGALLGITSFARLLGWLLQRYHDVMIALLTGFMLGSLRRIWPFKDAQSENVIPALFTPAGLDLNVVYAALLALSGAALVLLLDRISRRLH
jgi:putative membrane protein